MEENHRNKVGRFFIPESLIFGETTAVSQMMEGMIVMHCQFDLIRRGCEYVAYCPNFDFTEPNSLPRNYEIEKQRNGELRLAQQKDSASELQDLKAELAIAYAALERVTQMANLNSVAALNGAEHSAVQAVYRLRGEYAKLRDR